MGYSGKAIKGIGWTGFLQVALKGTSLIKFVLIARFLSPFELGLFGIAILTIGFFQALTETGISAYVVQTNETEEEYISSAWLVSFLRGILLFLLTLLFAYPISIFFRSPAAFILLLIVGFVPLINGFENPAVAKFQKYLDFHKEFLFRISISIFDLIVTSSLIIVYKNSLALVLGLVLATLFETIASFIFISPRPKLKIESEKIRKLFHFGKWITLVSSLNYFVEQMDSIVVGRVLGVGSLGIYELAQKFSLQVLMDVSYVFTKVTFPLFSRIRGDNERTKKALMKILLLVSFIFGGITLVMFIFSKEILLIFAGEKWIGADIPLKLFSLTGLVTAFMAIVTSMFLAHGRQDITAKILMGRLIMLAILIIPASLGFGVVGASFVSLISYVVVIPIAVIGVKKILNK